MVIQMKMMTTILIPARNQRLRTHLAVLLATRERRRGSRIQNTLIPGVGAEVHQVLPITLDQRCLPPLNLRGYQANHSTAISTGQERVATPIQDIEAKQDQHDRDDQRVQNTNPFSTIRGHQASYQHVRTLFKGMATFVDEVRHGATGILFARKRVRALNKSQRLADSFAREVKAMQRLSHAHIVQLADYLFEDSAYGLIIQPVGEFTLKQLLEAPQQKDTTSLVRWHSCLASAVSYMHRDDVSVCHLDIKPSNILISGSSVFLADFGIARCGASKTDVRDPDRTVVKRKSTPMTPKYAAPELILDGFWSRGADIFALGCVFLEMATVLCQISIHKYHQFLKQVQKQTQYLAEHDSWDVARALWIWVLIRRVLASRSSNAGKAFLERSVTTTSAMLRTTLKRRPSIQTISRAFMSFRCCTNISTRNGTCLYKRPPVNNGSTTDMVKFSVEDSQVNVKLQLAAVQRTSVPSRNMARLPMTGRNPAPIDASHAVSKAGYWDDKYTRRSYAATTFDDGQSSRPVCNTGDEFRGARRLRRGRSWPVIRPENYEPAETKSSSFVAFSGGLYLKSGTCRQDKIETRWYGWSRTGADSSSEQGVFISGLQPMRGSLIKALGYPPSQRCESREF